MIVWLGNLFVNSIALEKDIILQGIKTIFAKVALVDNVDASSYIESVMALERNPTKICLHKTD